MIDLRYRIWLINLFYGYNIIVDDVTPYSGNGGYINERTRVNYSKTVELRWLWLVIEWVYVYYYIIMV